MGEKAKPPTFARDPGSQSVRRLTFLSLAGALSIGVVFQGTLFARRLVALDARAGSVERMLTGPLDKVDAGLSQVLAWRSLPAMASQIPEGARVLLVSGTPMPAQFHYYFQPHPFTFLQPIDEHLLQVAVQRMPDMADALREQFERVERKGLRLTPERLQEELGSADYVAFFLYHEQLPSRPKLQLIAQDDVTALYRVMRD